MSPVGRLAVLLVASAGCSFVPTGTGADVIEDGAPGDGATDAATDPDATPPDAGPDAGLDAGPDAGPDANQRCAGYTVEVGTSRYRYSGILRGIDGARGDCEDDDPGHSHLATFEVAADLDATLDLLAIQAVVITPWVGATCDAQADCSQTTSWTWEGGGPVDPGLWGPG